MEPLQMQAIKKGSLIKLEHTSLHQATRHVLCVHPKDVSTGRLQVLWLVSESVNPPCNANPATSCKQNKRQDMPAEGELLGAAHLAKIKQSYQGVH
jgi:hypothetical protein